MIAIERDARELAADHLSEIALDDAPAAFRERVGRLEHAMRQMPSVSIPPKHYFADGIYAREIFIPKGTTLTGKIHKTTHLNIISQGDISVVTEAGVRRVQAPCTIVSPPGTKRVGYAHEDTVWTTICGSDEKDVDKLEALLIADEYEPLKAIA